jgi:DHA2 family multidrug resistance protein-like MFS transporter
LTTAASVVMAQSGALFVLAVFLQTTHHLSAAETGAWLLPIGVAVVIGAQAGGWLAGQVGATMVVRLGIAVDLGALAPILALFGLGAGLANSQLTNVILSDVPRDRAGSASGASTTNNAIAAALGVAIVATVLRAADATDAQPARSALLAAAAIAATGLLASLAIPRRSP